MKMFKAAMAAMAGAAALASAGAASALTYNLNYTAAAFSLPLGTVDVTGQGTSTLTFDVNLAPDVFFQAIGSSKPHDSFFFSLTGVSGAITSSSYNFITPAGGVAPGSMTFTGAAAGSYGQGSLKPFDYAVQNVDTAGSIDYYGGELKFTVTSVGGSLDLAPKTISGTTVYGGADLRQNQDGTIVTGPAGFTLERTPGVPEPAAWAMMLLGFGGLGVMLRYRRRELAAA